MPKIRVHFCGLIRGDFFDEEFEVEPEETLGDLEKKILAKYTKEISQEYRSAEGLLNHKLVRVGDAAGKRLDDIDTNISGLKEIWFVVPFAGG
ncbi:MAG: hypothetical protein ACPLTR_00735 [Thermacetogeniaceae bacterium]